jgi:hypothetical protein
VLTCRNIAIGAIFVAEMLAKIIAFGFKPYIRVLTNQVGLTHTMQAQAVG